MAVLLLQIKCITGQLFIFIINKFNKYHLIVIDHIFINLYSDSACYNWRQLYTGRSCLGQTSSELVGQNMSVVSVKPYFIFSTVVRILLYNLSIIWWQPNYIRNLGKKIHYLVLTSDFGTCHIAPVPICLFALSMLTNYPAKCIPAPSVPQK